MPASAPLGSALGQEGSLAGWARSQAATDWSVQGAELGRRARGGVQDVGPLPWPLVTWQLVRW